MRRSIGNPPRRRWLRNAATTLAAIGVPSLAALGAPRRARAHADAGPLTPPLPVPPLTIRWSDGSISSLAATLTGRITAVQTMFTACSTTCPLQGAIYAALEAELAADAPSVPDDLRLMSLSIDPLTDGPAELAAWLGRHGAGRHWLAGAPMPADVDRMLDFLRARSDRLDRHTGQVYLFDREARLVLRTVDLPPPEQTAGLMRQLRRHAAAEAPASDGRG